MLKNVMNGSNWLHGAQFMDDHCFDPNDGRMWFHLTREGDPIRKRRYAFTESFASIAYGELFKATAKNIMRKWHRKHLIVSLAIT